MFASYRKSFCLAALVGATMGVAGAKTTPANASDPTSVVQVQYYDSSASSLKDWFVAWKDSGYHRLRCHNQAEALAKFNYEMSLNHSAIYGYSSEFEGQVTLGRYQRR